MKRLIFFTMCLCSFMLMTSCSGGDSPIVGTWEQIIDQSGVKAVVTYDFKDSGKLDQKMIMKNEAPAVDIDIEGTCDYTYNAEDNTVNFKFSASDFDIKTFKMEGLTDDMVEMAKERMKTEMVNMEQNWTDVKIDGDKMTATFNGQQVTLTRK
ncbi:MAG: hypothetical protein ACI30D_00490 [Muribaculaceae bacterium]